MPTTSIPILADAAERFAPGVVSLDRANIYRDNYTSIIDIVETVRRWGIIVFPNFIAPDVLRKLNAELDLMVEVRHTLKCPIDEYENMINLRLDRGKYSTAFPASMAFFGQPFMQEIATAYFQPEDFRLNYEIFSTVLVETKAPQTKPPFALHFDKWHCLKFFVYLSDTDERNGAMRATPGSIVRNRPAREKTLLQVANAEQLENMVPEPAEPSIPISGPAGTLFIFDTDMNHGAGSVQPGFTRRNMRTHTITLKLLRQMGYRV